LWHPRTLAKSPTAEPAHGDLDTVAGGEVPGVVRELTHELIDRELHWVKVDDA